MGRLTGAVMVIGALLELGERWRIESYFRRQDNHGQSQSHENGIGLVLKYYR